MVSCPPIGVINFEGFQMQVTEFFGYDIYSAISIELLILDYLARIRAISVINQSQLSSY